jgi:BirA family biotin operon repressor/biotin-[acetyl-CoA-carboxylase] ligase
VPWPEGPERVRLPLTLGVVLARGLSSRFGIEVLLKWPNDLVSGGKKIGGVLVEVRTSGETGFAVCGVGLNVGAGREELDALGLTLAGSLLTAGAERSLLEGDAPAVSLLEILDEALERPEEGMRTIEDLPAEFLAVSTHRPGDRLAVYDAGEVVEGSFLGVTEDGFLRLEREGGVVTVLSGDVTAF